VDDAQVRLQFAQRLAGRAIEAIRAYADNEQREQ
jgi:hypothetical protein